MVELAKTTQDDPKRAKTSQNDSKQAPRKSKTAQNESNKDQDDPSILERISTHYPPLPTKSNSGLMS